MVSRIYAAGLIPEPCHTSIKIDQNSRTDMTPPSLMCRSPLAAQTSPEPISNTMSTLPTTSLRSAYAICSASIWATDHFLTPFANFMTCCTFSWLIAFLHALLGVTKCKGRLSKVRNLGIYSSVYKTRRRFAAMKGLFFLHFKRS